MLTYFPNGVMPDVDALRNGAEYNDDGHGYAIVAGSRLIIRKSMNADYLITQFTRDRSTHRNGPALFHSRISTAGSIDKANCHPFRFRGDRRTIVAHNGVLPAMAQPSKKDRRSDTRLAADEILPRKFGHLGYAPNRAQLAKWIGPHNKFVILTVNPVYSENAYLINESAGVWESRIWYSNRDYQGSCLSGLIGRFDDGSDECPFCGPAAPVNLDTGVCMRCCFCIDCLQNEEDCDCHIPASYAARKAIATRASLGFDELGRRMRAIEAETGAPTREEERHVYEAAWSSLLAEKAAERDE